MIRGEPPPRSRVSNDGAGCAAELDRIMEALSPEGRQMLLLAGRTIMADERALPHPRPAESGVARQDRH